MTLPLHDSKNDPKSTQKNTDGVLVDFALVLIVGVVRGRGERVLRVSAAPPQGLLPDIVRPRHQERQGVRRVLLPLEERLQGGGQELQEYLQLNFGGGGGGMFIGGNDEAVSQKYDIMLCSSPHSALALECIWT